MAGFDLVPPSANAPAPTGPAAPMSPEALEIIRQHLMANPGAYGSMGVQDPALAPNNVLGDAVLGMVGHALAIPKRAIDASGADMQQFMDTGGMGRTAVGPATDAALTMLGSGVGGAQVGALGVAGGKLGRGRLGGLEGGAWEDYEARAAAREAKEAAYDAMTPAQQATHDAAERAKMDAADAARIAANQAGMAASIAKRKAQIAKDVAAGKIPEGSTQTHREMKEMAASTREDARQNAADAAEAAADKSPVSAAPDFMNMKSMQMRQRPGWDWDD